MDDWEISPAAVLVGRATAKAQLSISAIMKPKNWRERLAAWLVGDYEQGARETAVTYVACVLAECASTDAIERAAWSKAVETFRGFLDARGVDSLPAEIAGLRRGGA